MASNYLELAAKIAQTVGDVSGMIAGIVGAGAGADPSGGQHLRQQH